MEMLIVFCTLPDRDTAQRIARALVEESLVACVNLLPGVESIYRWEGVIETSQEVLALMKTTEPTYAKLEARLKELHPYDVPEIVGVPVSLVQPGYAQWVAEMTKAG